MGVGGEEKKGGLLAIMSIDGDRGNIIQKLAFSPLEAKTGPAAYI